MLSGAQAQMSRYDTMRKMREAERGDQFAEDKYYTDLRTKSDPNYFPNWLDQQQAMTGRYNAQNAWQQTQNMAGYRQGMLDSREAQNANRAADIAERERHNKEYEQYLTEREGRLQNMGDQKAQQAASNAAETKRYNDARINKMQQDYGLAQQRLAQAAQSGDTKALAVAAQHMRAISELYKMNNDGKYIYGDQARQLAGVPAIPPPPPPKKKDGGIMDVFQGLMPKPQPKAAATSPMKLSGKKPPMSKDEVMAEMKRRGML